jgi:RimJ/RimL family protein N-acetyltransferase
MLKIYDKTLNKIISSTRFYSLDKIDSSIKIGFTFVVRECWGTTINYQVKDMMINYTFKFLDKIYFDIGVHNHHSRKAIEKIGAILFKDNVTNNVIYKLRKKDYVNNEIKKQKTL